MACFSGSQIGGSDFCAQTCDYDAMTPVQNGVACLKSNGVKTVKPNIQLKACKPSDDESAPNGACGQKDLQCYRTDLVEDEGVCTTMSPCAEDEDCTNPVRSVCATSFLSDTVYPLSKNLKRDHMFCLQTGCKARGTSCSAGESCLQDVIPPDASPPDICVPNCDSNLDCPPNFLCYRKVSTVVTPKVCIPGLLGFTCLDDMDCMLGKCSDTNIGYKVCTTRCDTEEQCQQFDGLKGLFTCVKNPAMLDEPGYCRTPDSFRGSLCVETKDCIDRNKDEVCTRTDPDAPMGTCLLPCSDENKCIARGGIKHTCMSLSPGAAPVCFPGYFGYPCKGDDNCIGDLSCRPAVVAPVSTCTKACKEDADCSSRWLDHGAWCPEAIGACQAPLDDGKTCPRDAACKSGKCVAGVCGPSAGGNR